MTIVLTPEQEVAAEAATKVLTSGKPGSLSIGGYAGTGKTTIIKSILERVDAVVPQSENEIVDYEALYPSYVEELVPKTVAVAAFTGKAVNVLRKKGIHRAQTLHRLMYEVVHEGGKLTFVRRDMLDCTSVIVDEASMLNKQLLDDLMSYGLPVVFIGDHGQLEPIGENPGVMVDPNIKLEKIHRQAESSPILQFAHSLRQSRYFDWNKVNSDELKRLPYDVATSQCHTFDVVLCGFNATRIYYNDLIRKRRGKTGKVAEGDRMICTRNIRRYGMFNGGMFEIVKVVKPGTRRFIVDIVTDEGLMLHGVTIAIGEDPMSVEMDTISCDYGYVITVHKFQGSEAENVLVFEECHPDWNRSRWCYTAATRASKKLAWTRKTR